MGDDEIWRSRGSVNDKFGIEVENEGRSEGRAWIKSSHAHKVKRAGLGLDVPELSVTYRLVAVAVARLGHAPL